MRYGISPEQPFTLSISRISALTHALGRVNTQHVGELPNSLDTTFPANHQTSKQPNTEPSPWMPCSMPFEKTPK